MAQVTLRINGFAYTLGCKDGEEKHLEAMGAEVARRVDGVRTASGPSGEARMLVMAALLMADDLFEIRARLQAAEAALRDRSPPQQPDPELSRKLNRMARRAEEIAEDLEHS